MYEKDKKTIVMKLIKEIYYFYIHCGYRPWLISNYHSLISPIFAIPFASEVHPINYCYS